MIVCFKSPCRIDLAGGTLDLWPLYNFFNKTQIVHMAINIYSYSQIEHTNKNKAFQLTIHSLDLKKQKTFRSLKALENYSHDKKNPLSWLGLLSHYFLTQKKSLAGCYTFKTKSEIPPGSGLGGSSVMSVSVAKAWIKILKLKKSSDWALQDLLKNLESVELGKPAGEQDYVPALFGGLLNFQLSPAGKSVEKLNGAAANFISNKCCLVYTGKPHHSGLNNWDIFQKFLNNNRNVKDNLFKISELSKKLALNLSLKRFTSFATLLNSEWETRQKLSKSVNAKELKQAWTYARKHGATARKACGAGGGGCLLVYFPNSNKCQQFLKTNHNSLTCLSFKPAKKGCFVSPCL